MLQQQCAAGGGEQKLIQTVQDTAKELEGLFEADVNWSESIAWLVNTPTSR